jgi:hypothetical protein
MNLWAAAVSISLGVLVIPIGRRCTGDYFHPAALVVAVWGLSFGLFLLNLMPFEPPGRLVLALIVAAVALLAGGALAAQWFERRAADDGPTWTLPNPRVWVCLLSILGLLGVAWYVGDVVRVFGWSGFADLARVRQALSDYTIPSTFMFLQVFTSVAPLLAFALVLCGTKLRRVDWVGPVACVLSTWATTSRMQFFLITLTAFFMFVARRGPRLSWAGFSLAVGTVGVLLLTNFAVVGWWTGKTPANLGMRMQISPRTGPQVSPLAARVENVLHHGATVYLYATGSYAALGQLMRQPLHSPHLTYTFYPAARLLQRLHLLDRSLPAPISPAVRIMRPPGPELKYNVYTFLYDPLMDFGPAGALVYTAVLGGLIGLVYGRFIRRRHSPVRLLLTAEIATALTLSIFANMFSNSLSWYILAGTVGPFVAARAFRRDNRGY